MGRRPLGDGWALFRNVFPRPVAIHWRDRGYPGREEALAKFTSTEWPIMVATDVAARGLDIKDVAYVVNFDMPRDVESYVHRIGRTGRAGASGKSLTFFNHAYDVPCSPALVKIARDAGQPVPDWLDRIAKKTGPGKKNWSTANLPASL